MTNLIGISGYIGSGKDEVAKMIQFLSLMGPSKRDFGVYQGEAWKIHGEQDRHWQIKKFAAKLKQIVSLLTGIPVADLEKESVKASELPKEWNTFEWLGEQLYEKAGDKPMTVRTLLQKLGTDAVRNNVHQNAWVNALFADYKPIGGKHYETGVVDESTGSKELGWEPEWPNWLISDCRFPNEAKAIKERDGIVVRINRPEPVVKADSDGFIHKIRHSSETSLDQWQFDYTIDNSGTIEELLEQVRTMLLHFKIIS